MRLDSKYIGSVRLLSEQKVRISQPTTVILEYTVGKYGIDESGNIKIAWRMVSDWEQPQFDRPKDFGYSTVKSSREGVILEVTRVPYERPFQSSMNIRVREKALEEGDTVTITFGDTTYGSLGIRAQSFVESHHEYKMLVDPLNTNKYVELKPSVTISVLNGPPNEIQCVAPSTIYPGQTFDAVVRVLDECGNPCSDYVGDAEITYVNAITGERIPYPTVAKFDGKSGGFLKIKDFALKNEGDYFLEVNVKEDNLQCLSNCIQCSKSHEYKLYWGDMHGQTDFTVGTGSLDEYFSFAKGPAALDFTGWQGNDFEINEEKWDKVREKCKEYNEEHSFLVYLGYEWSGNFPGGGDHNVFFLGDSEEFYPSSNWSERHESLLALKRDRFPISELFEEFRGRKDVMVIPHIGGRPANLDYYNKEFIPCIEIHSHHGTFEWFAKDAMERKLKVGFVASSDDHTCRPGLSYALLNHGQEANAFDVKSGLLGVYATELTKQAIWDAILARRCYGVTFHRINLDVRVGNSLMGEEVYCESAPVIKVSAKAQHPIAKIDILKGDKLLKTFYNTKPKEQQRTKEVKILWTGNRTTGRRKSVKWDGTLTIDKGRIINAHGVAFDTFQQGITEKANQIVRWTSSTSGDYDGISVTIDGPDDTLLKFRTPLKDIDIRLGDIINVPTIYPVETGINLQVEIGLQGEYSGSGPVQGYAMDVQYEDENFKDGFAAYWAKVTLEDGEKAFSSPIFVNIN